MQPIHTNRNELKRAKEKGFDDRLIAAANAKKAQVERFLARSAANASGLAERQSARHAVVAARDVRIAERKAVRLEGEAQLAAETAARAAALAAEQTARDVAAAEQAVRDTAGALRRQAEQKSARDARYAARQARGRK
jgi:hypothetical protein